MCMIHCNTVTVYYTVYTLYLSVCLVYYTLYGKSYETHIKSNKPTFRIAFELLVEKLTFLNVPLGFARQNCCNRSKAALKAFTLPVAHRRSSTPLNEHSNCSTSPTRLPLKVLDFFTCLQFGLNLQKCLNWKCEFQFSTAQSYSSALQQTRFNLGSTLRLCNLFATL